MVSTAVLLTAILASYALIAGAFYALTAQLGARIDDVGDRLTRFEGLTEGRFDRLDGRLDRLTDDVTGLRAAVGGIDARISTLEQRG